MQEITQQHNVSIKFPDREETDQGQVTDGETDPRDVIVITGRKENCEAAKLALLVREQGGDVPIRTTLKLCNEKITLTFQLCV